MRDLRRGWLMAAVVLAPAAWAEPLGVSQHGAGGPYAGAILFVPPTGGRMGLVCTGGAGYTYFLGGRLRLGGGGQSAVLSFADQPAHGHVSWGGILLGYDPFAEGNFELPIGLQVGGDRWIVERTLEAGSIERLERESSAFFALQLFTGPEWRIARLVKVALQFSWLFGIHAGTVLHVGQVQLQLVFLLPR